MTSVIHGVRFSDEDIVNKDDFIPKDEYNPHNVHPFILHDMGFVVCVVFASNLQDALDEAVDAGKMNRYLIACTYNTPGAIPGHDEIWDYVHDVPATEEGFDIGGRHVDFNDDVTFLGNASEPFDVDTLQVIELPNPPYSFCAMLNA